MTWIVGIDEAGYGPNLGPFVMSAVACRVPQTLTSVNLWRSLKRWVRKTDGADDGRLLIDDSKLVYSSGNGLRNLEMSVLTHWMSRHPIELTSLTKVLELIAFDSLPSLASETWFRGNTQLPTEADLADCHAAVPRLARGLESMGFEWGEVFSVVICAQRFNEIVDRWGSKGAVLAFALTELMMQIQRCRRDTEPLQFFIDKHGGRNTYAAMLQHAWADGYLQVKEECGLRSHYSIQGLPYEVEITVQPRADNEHLCVALASMTSKYLRELLMMEFNAYWKTHIPDLKPTAGYPNDAARFFEAIRPEIRRLGLDECTIWRRK